MKSTLALSLSVLALALAAFAVLRPPPVPQGIPAPTSERPPVISFPPPDGWGDGWGDWCGTSKQPLPDAWLPSAWDPEDR